MQRFDAGTFMCRVDFRQSPTVYHTVELDVIGKDRAVGSREPKGPIINDVRTGGIGGLPKWPKDFYHRLPPNASKWEWEGLGNFKHFADG